VNDVNDTNDDAVQAIRDIVAERVRAVRAKDPEPLAHQQADDIITFDVVPPLRSHGVDAVAANTHPGSTATTATSTTTYVSSP